MTGPSRARTLLLATLALGALCAAGCGSEAVQFNDTLVRGLNKVDGARKKFEDALKRGNAGAIRVAHTTLLVTVGEVKRDVAAAKVPASASAQQFADRFQNLLRSYEEVVKDLYAERIRMGEDSEKTPPDELKKKSQELALKEVKAYQQLQSQMNELQELQRAFAREHNIRLKAPSK